MGLNQAAFARLAGVSRQAIHQHIKGGNIVLDVDGTIDPDHPQNQAYLARTMSGTSRPGPAAQAEPPNDDDEGQQMLPMEDPEPATDGGSPPPSHGASTVDDLQSMRRQIDAAQGSPKEGEDPVTQMVRQKAYWDIRKVQEDVLRRQLEREERIGNLVDRSVIKAAIGAFQQAIVANFVDSCERQALQICQMLGMEGKSRIVIEFLEKDNKRRLEECDRAVHNVLQQMRRPNRHSGEIPA